jgi:hypothetical protein
VRLVTQRRMRHLRTPGPGDAAGGLGGGGRRGYALPLATPMFRQKGAITAVAVALVASAAGAAPGVAAPSRVPDPKRVQAEHDVLGFLQQDRGRRWILRHPGGRHLFSRLFDPHTHLLRNNTLVTCRRARGRGRGRFYCVVRPARHRLHEGLHLRYVRYRLGEGHFFRIKWLYYRRG